MRNRPGYPEPLEHAWLQHAMQVTGARQPRAAVARLESAAGSLSDAFTTGRDPSFADYHSDRRALAAYGLFFFPRAFVRTLLALGETCGDFAPSRIVDLGAGTGAAGLACLHYFRQTGKVRLTLVDQSGACLDLSREIYSSGRSLWPESSISTMVADARDYRGEGGSDLIISSFAINEWMEREPSEDRIVGWVRQQLANLRKGGRLILLEPALRTTVERMERLRDYVVLHALARIIAPCPHHASCPMLAEKRGWCHEVREWRVPESLRWINRRLQRDVHLLKFSMLVLENHPPSAEAADWMRLVSPVRKEKGKYVFHGCGSDGQIHTCEWLTRNLSKEQMSASEILERGDRVLWNKAAVLGDGRTERGDGPPSIVNGT